MISLSLKSLRGSMISCSLFIHKQNQPPPNYISYISMVFFSSPIFSKIRKKSSNQRKNPTLLHHLCTRCRTSWKPVGPLRPGFPTSNLPVPSPFGSFRCWFCVNHEWLCIGIQTYQLLVGGFKPSEKILVNMEIFPKLVCK